jgi:hypothetical protein
MSTRHKRLVRDLEKAEAQVAKKKKLVLDEVVNKEDAWYTNLDNLRKFLIRRMESLHFDSVKDGKLVYSGKVNINRVPGSYSYRVYEISCRLSTDHPIFTSVTDHKHLEAEDIIDDVEFKFIEYYYDDYC